MIALHEADILHADFKPETIMLTGIDVPKMINHIEKLLKARDYCITEYESLDERDKNTFRLQYSSYYIVLVQVNNNKVHPFSPYAK